MRRQAKYHKAAMVGSVVLAGLMIGAMPAAAENSAAHALAEKFSRAGEESQRAEAAKKAQEEQARAQAAAAKKAEEKRQRAEASARKAEQERQRAAAAEQARRKAAEQRAADEADMLRRAAAEAEARRLKEQRRTEEMLRAEEKARVEAQREAARAEAARLAREAEAKHQDEARRAEQTRAAEAARLAREVEAQRRAEDQRKAEAARQAEAARLAEEAQEKQRAEARRQAEEAAHIATAKAEEAKRKAAEQAALEARRLEEVQRIAEKFRLAREARERKRAVELEMETRHSLGGPIPPAEPETAAPSRTTGSRQAQRLPTRVTVLLVLERRRHGLSRRQPNPVLCIGGGCYVSGGADDAADYMRRWKALGPGNTLGRRAGPCRGQLTCVFRGVELGAEAAPIQPVDMGFWGHDRREVQTARPDMSCKVVRGELSCADPVVAHGYRAWIVPESVATQAGPGALEEALEDGLPDGRSGVPDRWEARVQDLPRR